VDLLVDPVSPDGFGGTRGLDGELCDPSGAGSGGGTANPGFVGRLAAGDRGDGDPLARASTSRRCSGPPWPASSPAERPPYRRITAHSG
jgi:hypothetical protein